jgi:hypothetical protein
MLANTHYHLQISILQSEVNTFLAMKPRSMWKQVTNKYLLINLDTNCGEGGVCAGFVRFRIRFSDGLFIVNTETTSSIHEV